MKLVQCLEQLVLRLGGNKMFDFFKKNTVPKRVYLNDVFLKETNEELKVSDKFEEKYVVYKVIETDLKTKKYFVKELIYCG